MPIFSCGEHRDQLKWTRDYSRSYPIDVRRNRSIAVVQEESERFELGERGRDVPEQRIVVVSHGDCLRYITRGFNDHEPWANVEVREYTFAVDDEDDKDGEASLVPVTRVVPVGGEPEPTSSEQAGL